MLVPYDNFIKIDEQAFFLESLLPLLRELVFFIDLRVIR
jgi:hypothetical protein